MLLSTFIIEGSKMADEPKKRGRQPTGRTSGMVRIPLALKPAVAELVETYRQAKIKAWEAAPLRQPAAQPDREPAP